MTQPVVLILTHPRDRHADAVQPHLAAAGVQVCRMDTAALATPAYPVAAHLRHGRLTGHLGDCDLTRVVGVWHRRPCDIPTTVTPQDAAELRAGLGGVLAALPYLNRPADMAAAGYKPYQLALATRCGLRVPETLITTDRAAAAALAARHQAAVVVKPMSHQVRDRLVTEADRTGWDRIIHLTQQRITTTRHVRLTAVDSNLFAALIESPHLDWRRDENACRYQATTTPHEVAEAIRRMLAGLRLRFAALDFALDEHDRWWFLEVNPNGQWLWIEHATGLPIAASIATALRLGTPNPAPQPPACRVAGRRSPPGCSP
jgi:hypothetical protein